MKKTRLNKKGKQVVTALLIILIIILMLLVFAGIKLYERYSPTKERMSYEDYFELTDDSQVKVYMNDEELKEDVVKAYVADGRCYLPQEYVADNLNCRFYEDKNTGNIIYTVADNMYYFAADETYYTDRNQSRTDTDYAVVKEFDGKLCIAVEYVKEHTDFEYRFYNEPYRLFMWDTLTEKTYTNLTRDTAIRFRGGIKSPIIADGIKDQKVEVLLDLEDWIEIRTEDGYMGYVPAKAVGDLYAETMESTYVAEALPQSNLMSEKINLVFHSVGTQAFNGELLKSALGSTNGVNVISPTWYNLTSDSGDMSCLANKDYVDKAHEMGIKVWALVADHDTSLDRYEIFSNKDTRTKIINTLISDAKNYGFDGINIDFEKLAAENAQHFLQFMRELSFECRANGIVLSTDIYVPAAFNMFYNRSEQGVWADYVIIMGYDEYWSGSSEAGPVASIGYVRDGITNTLKEVPAEKVINAMPFYVRVWRETTNTDNTVSVTSRAVGMDSARKLLDDNKAPIMWDEEKGLYYGSYEDGNDTVKIWLEDERSIEEKMKAYKENNLAGVGGWRLGLEKTAVWTVIQNYLN